MTEALVTKAGLVGIKTVLAYLRGCADPNLSRSLDDEIIAHLLSEVPRIYRLLEERVSDVEGSGCTPSEVFIIVHQVIESQKRIFEEEKRRRLSNVLINGLTVKRWNKARHRLMVRFATELEEEHVDVLRRRTFSGPASDDPMSRAIERELVSRGLVDEETTQVPNPKWKPAPGPTLNRAGHIVQPKLTGERVPEFIDRTMIRSSRFGHEFLALIRDPEQRIE